MSLPSVPAEHRRGLRRMPPPLAVLGPPAQLAAIIFAMAAAARLIGSALLEAAPPLFMVLAVLEGLAMIAGWAVFALSGLTDSGAFARISAWVLTGVQALSLLVALISWGVPNALLLLGVIGWLLLASGIVFGIAFSRDQGLPPRFRLLPLAYFVIVFACIPVLADEPLLASYVNGVILLLFAACLYFLERAPLLAADVAAANAPAAVRSGADASATTVSTGVQAAPSEPASATSTPASGWYQDPVGGGGLRWWDGWRWTEHVSPAPDALPSSPTASERGDRND